MAVIVVPARFVPLVSKECIEKGVEAAIIISAGFGEIGEKGLTAELQKVIDSSKKTKFLGPNCFGVLTPGKLNTTFSEEKRMKIPKFGNVAFMSQSGALGVTILDWMHTQEFGLSKFVSYGNAMGLDEADFLEFVANDKETKVITMYLEGVKRGRKFFEIAKKAGAKKPIIALKGGVTEETHKATASHTGSLAGSARVYHGLFKQTGITQANSLEELFAFAKIFENEPLPKGKRVGIISNGGGYAIITADEVVKNGLQLAGFSEKTRQTCRKAFPPTVNIGNPLDLVGDADAQRYKIAIENLLNDDNVDMLAVLVLFNVPTINETIIGEIAKLRKKAKKPMIVVSTGSEFTKRMLQELEKNGVVTFGYPSRAAKALKALADYAEFKKEK